MERALHSQDVVKAVLSYLDHYTLLRRGARVSRGWQRVIEAGGLGEEACRLAFWSHYRSQDECYPNDFATISTSSFSWRKECKSRRLNGWSPREDIVGPSTVCDITGDVIFAVAATPVDSLFICGGENGILYFIDITEEVGKAIRYHFEAHTGTLLALSARKSCPGRDGVSMYHVISGDTLGCIQINAVDVVHRTRHILYTLRLKTSVLHFVRLRRDMQASALRDGTVVCWRDYSGSQEKSGEGHGSGEANATHAHNGEVTHFTGIGEENRVRLLVTASNSDQNLRTWRTAFGKDPGNSVRVELEPVQVLSLASLSVGSLCTSSGMSVAPDGVVTLGFGNGRVCSLDAYTCSLISVLHVHDDEVWDVRSCGSGMVVTSSRDRSVAVSDIRSADPSDHFRLAVGNWIVRVKATPACLLLLGFDAQLRVVRKRSLKM